MRRDSSKCLPHLEVPVVLQSREIWNNTTGSAVGTWSRPRAPLATPLQGPVRQGSSHRKRHPEQQYLSKSPLTPSFPISCLTSAKQAVAVTRSLTEQESSHGKRFFTRQGETSPACSRMLCRGHKRGTHSYPGRPQAGPPKFACADADAILQLPTASRVQRPFPWAQPCRSWPDASLVLLPGQETHPLRVSQGVFQASPHCPIHEQPRPFLHHASAQHQLYS